MRDYSYYLDKAKDRNGFKYDRELDLALGFKGYMSCQLKKGKTHLSDDKMVELAELAGLDTEVALIDLNIWRSSSNRTRQIMEGILQKMPQMACLLIAVGVIFTSHTAPSHAISNLSSDAGDNIYYGKQGIAI